MAVALRDPHYRPYLRGERGHVDAIIEDGVNRLLCWSGEESWAGPVGTARRSGARRGGCPAEGRDFCWVARRESKYTGR